MTLGEYQMAALKTARDKTTHNEFFHLLLGLIGETGEIAEKMKKVVRDQNTDLSKVDTADLKKELGDTLWYLTVLADFFDISLEEVAKANIDKLADRQKRGVLDGSGDNR